MPDFFNQSSTKLDCLLIDTIHTCTTSNNYLSTDYFGTRLIIFDNNMNTIGNHFLYQVRGQISCIYD